jgi:hypothetical protein
MRVYLLCSPQNDSQAWINIRRIILSSPLIFFFCIISAFCAKKLGTLVYARKHR